MNRLLLLSIASILTLGGNFDAHAAGGANNLSAQATEQVQRLFGVPKNQTVKEAPLSQAAAAPQRPQVENKPRQPAGTRLAQGSEPTTQDEMFSLLGTTAKEEAAIDEAAFRGVMKQQFPLKPEQIIRLRQARETKALAEATAPGTPPRPIATSQFVNLSPGSTPPVIRLAQGFVSSLVFLDSSGAPWPIEAYDLGNPEAFNIQWDKTSNTLMIQANQLYTYGNLAVRLRELNTPVMITLIPGQKAVDYRVDLRVQGYGPEAKSLPITDALPGHASPLLLSLLDGAAPQGSQVLTVSGGRAQVWLVGKKMYVRTRLTVLSPGWLATMSSADGTKVYEMYQTPVILASAHGKITKIKVEGL